MTLDIEIDALRAGFAGSVLTPEDPEYERGRGRWVWNGDINRSPAVVARCATAEDVAAAVRIGRASGSELTVRGGGHGFSGLAICDGGVMIDLSRMRDVRVDPDARIALCGGGSTLADLDAASQAHGLAVPGGTISHTGVAGLTLGGGFGWLTGMHGLSADNLAAAEVVLADGSRVRASEDEHPDLFWALRGGGGNFGVVTSFEFRLHPVGPLVNLGLFFWGLDGGAEALRLARDLRPTLPRASMIMVAALNAPPAPFVPEQYHFQPGYAIIVTGFATPEEHEQLIAPVRAAGPLFELVTPIPYTELQKMLDEAAPWGIRAYEKSLYVDELTDDVIAVTTEQAPRKRSPMSLALMFSLAGAFCDPDEDNIAFGGSRTPKYAINFAAVTDDPDVLPAERQWARDFWQALTPYSRESAGYINFMNEYDEDRLRAAFGPAKYDRLARIKAEYDPDNVFHHNQNIKPAS
jgi:FAD/FMN-containing dehydrogenase